MVVTKLTAEKEILWTGKLPATLAIRWCDRNSGGSIEGL